MMYKWSHLPILRALLVFTPVKKLIGSSKAVRLYTV
jgi:hypothetical protein